MSMSSHRGKIELSDNELFAVFELAQEQDVAGYFKKQQKTTVLLDQPTGDVKQDYAYYSVAYTDRPMTRTITTGFGVTVEWIVGDEAPAYLGIFKGYGHPRPEDLVGYRQMASYYIMVINAAKPDPETKADSIETVRAKLTIDTNSLQGANPLTAQVVFAPIQAELSDVETKPAAWVPVGSNLVLDGLSNPIQTGAYTVVEAGAAQASSGAGYGAG